MELQVDTDYILDTDYVLENDSFLSALECDRLIRFFEENKHLIEPYNETELIQLNEYIRLNTGLDCDFIRYIHAKLTYQVQSVNSNIYIDYFQIVRWREGSWMDGHKDFTQHALTGLVYLNDDYEGGTTFVEDATIQPVKGKLVMFNGSKMYHGVNMVTKGTRYMLPVWCKAV